MAGHDSAFATALSSVTDPYTPVWNGLVTEFSDRFVACGLLPPRQADAVGADRHDTPDDGTDDAGDGADADAGSTWPLDENATFHGVSHR